MRNLGRRIARIEAAEGAARPSGPLTLEDFLAGRLPRDWSLGEAIRQSYEETING